MTTSMQTIGVDAFRDTLKTGGDIFKLLTHLSANRGILAGAVSGLVACYCAVRAAGYKCGSNDAELDTFLHSPASVMCASLAMHLGQSRTDDALGVKLSILASEVTRNREKITWPAPVAATTAPPEPLAVRVVGMPDRVTEMDVKYTAAGDIKSTTQTERDAV